ncbi:MAG: GyrI-like domain-containing protein [Streptosporangiaceae bacterium]
MSLPPDVTVTHVAERPTAVIAATTTWRDFPMQWKPMLDQVYACLRRHGSAGQGCNVMLYKDDIPQVEVGVELITPCVLDSPVIRSRLPAGEVAMTVHRGPYQDLRAAHDIVTHWCAANGRALAGPRWEVYGDWSDDPAELETEVYYLLR